VHGYERYAPFCPFLAREAPAWEDQLRTGATFGAGLTPWQEERAAAHPPPVGRRAFLQKSAMAVAGGILFSCTGGRVVPRVGPSSSPALTADTRTPIKRVIYVMLENRSFDNLFGRFPGVNGATVGNMLGREKPLLRCPDWLPGDLGHDHASAMAQFNGGKLDNFGINTYGDPWAYTQFGGPEIPAYWHWASEYAISDNFFASAIGPSYPNHFFYVAGTSGGTVDNPENIRTQQMTDASGKSIGIHKSWGCDAYGDGTFVFTTDAHGQLAKHDTCFQFPTVGEQLSAKGIDWAYYSAPDGQIGYMWNAYNGVHGVFHTDLWHEHCTRTVGYMTKDGSIVQSDLLRDIEAGTLPSVSWVTPRFELSDHPPASTSWTHNWIMEVVNAVMRSDMWEHTAIFLTWDEWGGFYDHVVPPQVDEVGLGFRVPLLTISPYTPRGLIDSEVGEFSTPLRFIADNWGLAHLTPRIKRTHNMDHLFDFSKPPRKPSLATKKAKTYGDPFVFPHDYPGWPAATSPATTPVTGDPFT